MLELESTRESRWGRPQARHCPCDNPCTKSYISKIQIKSLSWSVTLVLLLTFSLSLPSVVNASSEESKEDEQDRKAVDTGDSDIKEPLIPHGPKDFPADVLDPKGQSNKDDGAKGIVDMGFIHAFVASLSVIIVSELGDKTFFIAAIMAMRHSRLTVFIGAIGALGLMTVLSALLGYATTVIPRWFTFYASSALFAIFGLKMLREGYYMSADEGKEEYEEVQADLRKKDEEADKENKSGVGDIETGLPKTMTRGHNFLRKICSRVFLQSFTLTFLAEWGDRSQISTIILAARDEVIGVIIGGTLGHALCTGLAVLGGRFVAQRISIRTVTLIGGVVFLIFALSTFVIQIEEEL